MNESEPPSPNRWLARCGGTVLLCEPENISPLADRKVLAYAWGTFINRFVGPTARAGELHYTRHRSVKAAMRDLVEYIWRSMVVGGSRTVKLVSFLDRTPASNLLHHHVWVEGISREVLLSGLWSMGDHWFAERTRRRSTKDHLYIGNKEIRELRDEDGRRTGLYLADNGEGFVGVFLGRDIADRAVVYALEDAGGPQSFWQLVLRLSVAVPDGYGTYDRHAPDRSLLRKSLNRLAHRGQVRKEEGRWYLN